MVLFYKDTVLINLMKKFIYICIFIKQSAGLISPHRKRPSQNHQKVWCLVKVSPMPLVFWSLPESVESCLQAPCPGRHCPVLPQPGNIKMLSLSDVIMLPPSKYCFHQQQQQNPG